VIARDKDGRAQRHFVILAFAARWLSGELRLNEELADAKWLYPLDLTSLETTEGLAEIVDAAFAHMVDSEIPGG
jgi:NADH pyrophosphatase NudC (nudix superfamily)